MIIKKFEFINFGNNVRCIEYNSKYAILINDIILNYIILNNKKTTGYAKELFYFNNGGGKYYFTSDMYFI